MPDVVSRIYDPQRAEIYRRYGIQTFAPTAWSAGKIIEFLTSANLEREQSVRQRRGRDDGRVGADSTSSASRSTTCACPARSAWRSSCAWAAGMLPVSGTQFEVDDQVHVLVHQSAVEKFQKMMGWKCMKVIVAGAGTLGRRVTRYVSEQARRHDHRAEPGALRGHRRRSSAAGRRSA